MALPTITVTPGAGQTISTPNSGRQAAADSQAMVLATEDLAAIGATNETASTSDTAASGLNGRLQRIAQRLTSLIGLVPAALANGRFKVALRDTSDAEVGVTANPLFTRASIGTVAFTDISGTIATAGTAVQAAAAKANRAFLMIQNTSSADITVSTVGTASATSGMLLKPGVIYEYPPHGTPSGAVSVWGAAAGQTWQAREV